MVQVAVSPFTSRRAPRDRGKRGWRSAPRPRSWCKSVSKPCWRRCLTASGKPTVGYDIHAKHKLHPCFCASHAAETRRRHTSLESSANLQLVSAQVLYRKARQMKSELVELH